MAQATPPAGRQTCTVNTATPTEADKALQERKYDDAEKLYAAALAADPKSSAAMAGQVRALLGEGKLAEGLALATRDDAAKPNDALLLDALGEARFRRGEVEDAAQTFNKANHIDPCVGWVHADFGRYQTLAGNFLSAQKQLDVAHNLSPNDPVITMYWREAHATVLSPEQYIARLTARMNAANTSDADKKEIAEQIKRVKARNNGNCEAVEPRESLKIPMFAVEAVNKVVDSDLHAVSMDVTMNGKRQRLEIDSGASGLVISRAAADRAGLTTEAEAYSFGVGDEGVNRTFITHVDKLIVGGIEFHNCEVNVLDRSYGSDLDGLIGPDVFARWVVTLDIPGREVRLDPLPKRPGDAEGAEPLRLDVHGVTGNGLASNDAPHDRYVAPDMQTWTKIYRHGHDLIFPVRVNELPPRLFIMDSGWEGTGSLNMDVGKMLGRMSPAPYESHGISGYVKKLYLLEKQVMLNFAGIKSPVDGIEVLDLTQTTRNVPVEISGFIGFGTLRNLVISIDYRDNLVKVAYDASKGFHTR